MLDITQIRSATPGCDHCLHFNNAGAALMPRPVIDAVNDYFQFESLHGGYEAAREYRDEIAATYEVIADFIGAEASEIALSHSATDAWTRAFYALPLKSGDTIVTGKSEYASNYLAFLQLAERLDLHIQVIPNDPDGQISVEALQSTIDDKVRLIAISHAPTNGGLINPVREIGFIAKQHGITFMVDACQTIGQLPINVLDIGCDILTATGRKYLRGPRGTGFLYIANSLQEKVTPHMIDLHAATWLGEDRYEWRKDAKAFESWERNYANVLGLKAAVAYAQELGVDNIGERVVMLGAMLRDRLSALPDIMVHDLGEHKGGIVSFSHATFQAAALYEALYQQHIHTSVATKEDTFLDMNERGIEQMLRASVHYYNTEAEIEDFVRILSNILLTVA